MHCIKDKCICLLVFLLNNVRILVLEYRLMLRNAILTLINNISICKNVCKSKAAYHYESLLKIVITNCKKRQINVFLNCSVDIATITKICYLDNYETLYLYYNSSI